MKGFKLKTKDGIPYIKVETWIYCDINKAIEWLTSSDFNKELEPMIDEIIDGENLDE